MLSKFNVCVLSVFIFMQINDDDDDDDELISSSRTTV